MIVLAVLTSIILASLVIEGRGLRAQVPSSLEAKDCASPAPPDELPNDRFIRKGGRTTPHVKVLRQGTALTIDNVAQGRDLLRYDRLELADPEPRAVSERRSDSVRAQARTFLWNQWRERKEAYLVLTLSSVDATSTSHVFIEKDDTGRWRVYWRIVRHHGEIDDLPTAYAVKWVLPGDWREPGTPLAKGQEPDPVRHRLEFSDICDSVEHSF
ncbi:MAG: hypothetical protein LAO78_18550 [Acidobacteriia bacterium]|nr:hypothetical protein [Terriglobia bacterium]